METLILWGSLFTTAAWLALLPFERNALLTFGLLVLIAVFALVLVQLAFGWDSVALLIFLLYFAAFPLLVPSVIFGVIKTKLGYRNYFIAASTGTSSYAWLFYNYV